MSYLLIGVQRESNWKKETAFKHRLIHIAVCDVHLVFFSHRRFNRATCFSDRDSKSVLTFLKRCPSQIAEGICAVWLLVVQFPVSCFIKTMNEQTRLFVVYLIKAM